MATLQRIRNRAGLLVAIIIGLALVAFILGDLLKTGSSLLNSSQMEIGDINGTSIQYTDFQTMVDETSQIYKLNTGSNQLDESTMVQIREQVWAEVVQSAVMTDIYDDLGLSVSSDEMFDMVQGTNIHPIIQQLFANSTTGQFDKTAVLQFLKSLDNGATQDQKAYWLYIEDQIKKDQILTKYENLVGQGLFVTTPEAELSAASKAKKANIQYISLNYSSVADSSISVTEKEQMAYYNAHLDEYEQENSRKIEYITFSVVATDADDASTLQWIEDANEEFATIEDNEQYVNVNSDIRFDNSYYKQEDLTEELSAFAFGGNTNDTYGPYREGNTYRIAKIDDIKNLPDSVKASHILFTSADALTLADSIKTLIENGASFSAMAKEYSQDSGSAANGGDVGWFRRNQMVEPFEEACFNGDVNNLYITTSNYGVHLIKPTQKGKEVKQVRLAILARTIEPGTQTYQNVYAQASKFVSENLTGDDFQSAVTEQNLNKKIVSVSEGDREIAGLDQPRSLVRAAYEADIDDILTNSEGSTIFEFGDDFVVATLTEINEKGAAPYENVKVSVELAVKKEKKAEVLIAKMKEAATSSDLGSIAETLNVEVMDANGIIFNQNSISGIGIEPALIGTISSLEENQMSAPIKGNYGVYLAKIVSSSDENTTDVLTEKQTLKATFSSRALTSSYEAQKNAVDIEDKRAKFY